MEFHSAMQFISLIIANYHVAYVSSFEPPFGFIAFSVVFRLFPFSQFVSCHYSVCVCVCVIRGNHAKTKSA